MTYVYSKKAHYYNTIGLMHDFRCADAGDMFYPELADSVKKIKEEEGGGIFNMTVKEMKQFMAERGYEFDPLSEMTGIPPDCHFIMDNEGDCQPLIAPFDVQLDILFL